LFDLGFEGFEFGIHGPHYRGKNAAWSRTKPLFSKWFIGAGSAFLMHCNKDKGRMRAVSGAAYGFSKRS
jgi:hypothetical protein